MVVSAGLRETWQRFDCTVKGLALDPENPLRSKSLFLEVLTIMYYGVVFPQIEFGNDIQAIKDYAQTAEALGYDYLLVYDHVLGAHPNREPKLTGPYTYEDPFHEPMVFFGFLAAITTRLELVTGILILPQRQ